MALPTTISDITFLGVDSQGRNRPWVRSSTGDVYYFSRDGGTNTQLNAFKATDPTDSFSQQATLAIDSGGVLLGIGTYQEGDNVHIVTQDDNEAILYHVYSMSSDSFTTSNEAVTSAVGTNVDSDKACSISLNAAADEISLFYQGASDNDMGAKERVDRAYKVSGSWTVDEQVDSGGAVNFYVGGLVRGEADAFFARFFSENGVTFAEQRIWQDVDGTIGSRNSIGGGTTTQDFSVTSPAFYQNGGAEEARVASMYVVNGGDLREAMSVDGLGLSGSHGLGSVTPEFNGVFLIACMAADPDEATMWAAYAQSGNDLYTNFKVDNASGDYADESEFLDAVTINLLTTNIYERDGNMVLAFVYDNAGTIQYNEFVIRAVGGADPPNLFSHRKKRRIGIQIRL